MTPHYIYVLKLAWQNYTLSNEIIMAPYYVKVLKLVWQNDTLSNEIICAAYYVKVLKLSVHSIPTVQIIVVDHPNSFRTKKSWFSGYGKETHVPKVVGSHPTTVYWMDIFIVICCKKCIVCLKRQK